MNFGGDITSGFDPNLQSEIAQLSQELIHASLKATDEWMDACSRRHLPPAIYRAAHARKHQHLVANYIHNHGYREAIWQTGWRYFMKGELYLGAFRSVFVGSRHIINSHVFLQPLLELPPEFKAVAPRSQYHDF